MAIRGRGESLERQLKLMQILDERRQLAVHDVAKELGWTARTVYRDLIVLERVGVPIYQDRQGTRSRWRVVDTYRKRLSVTLSWPEMLALSAGRDLLAGSSGSLFHESAISALDKIRGALPAELVKRAETLANGVSAAVGIQVEGGRSRAPTMTLIEAIERCETVRMSYRSRADAKARERLVDPYHLHLQTGGTYLIGYSHERKETRTFLVERILQANGTGQRFERSSGFKPGEFLQGAFGPWSGRAVEIKLVFKPEAAPFVAERRYHPTQRAQWNQDGTLEVSLRAPESPALVRWLVGWGAAVDIEAPAALHKRVEAVHKAVL